MDNDNYITLTDEGIAEINPTASSDAQMAFIDTYRQIQGENTAQIGEAAHALGSDLEAQYGGLHGPSEYIRSRYQTPQTESRIAGLRTAAQLSALNQLMQNDINRMKNRYGQAYRAAQKRAGSGGSGSTTTTGGGNDGETEKKYTDIDTISKITNAPLAGFSDTSYYDLDGRLHNVYTQGTRRIEYIDGELVSDNTKEVVGNTGNGGGGW